MTAAQGEAGAAGAVVEGDQHQSPHRLGPAGGRSEGDFHHDHLAQARQAVALASAISDTTTVAPEIARLQGIALAGVFQIIISEAGQRTLEGQSQSEIANELHPTMENVLDELDRWLSV